MRRCGAPAAAAAVWKASTEPVTSSAQRFAALLRLFQRTAMSRFACAERGYRRRRDDCAGPLRAGGRRLAWRHPRTGRSRLVERRARRRGRRTGEAGRRGARRLHRLVGRDDRCRTEFGETSIARGLEGRPLAPRDPLDGGGDARAAPGRRTSRPWSRGSRRAGPSRGRWTRRTRSPASDEPAGRRAVRTHSATCARR